MKENVCQYEQSVLKERAATAAAADAATLQNPELAAHLAGCADCRETLKVAGWMHEFASAADRLPNIPKPGFIWWKARLLEKQKKAERAARPILWMQIAALVLVFSTAVWILMTNQASFAPTWKALSGSLELLAGTPLAIVSICGAFVYLALAYKKRREEPSGKKK